MRAEAAPSSVAVTPENAAVINLLSPFLSLNSTAIGQQTLQVDLSQAVAINQNASSVAVLNDYMPTATLGALAISDENLLGAAQTTVNGLPKATTYGVAANLAGGLPTQNTTAWALYSGQQPIGGFGSILGAAYVNDVGSAGATVTLPNTVALLTTANNQIVNTVSTGDSQVAKFYFANGTENGLATAIAPTGYTLPTANGYPNTTTSVYDTAFGVKNTQSGQNSYGDSHPYQIALADGTTYTLYDSTVSTACTSSACTTASATLTMPKPSTNPAFPSSHMAYAMSDSLLLGMMVPQLYQSMLMRASEMGNSRVVVGVHYPTDIIASRAMASFDLANLLNNPSYISNAAVTGTAVNMPSMFEAAAPELQGQLTTAAATAGCGTSLTTCATSSTNANPYAPSATNAAVYAARLTYGLPTLTFAQAPQEQAPSGSPDASILLATLYGGSSSTAQALATAAGGALYGNLSTATIDQIIVNTETNAIAAFYGTSLSYWSRINLYAAAGYFQDVTGTITLASTDQVNTNVTVANTGVLAGSGKITGNVVFQSGGALAVTGNGNGVVATPTVSGAVTFQSGSQVQVGGMVLPGTAYTILNTTAGSSISVGSGVTVVGSWSSPFLTGSLTVVGDPVLALTTTSSFHSAAVTQNQMDAATGLDNGANAGRYGSAGQNLLTSLLQNTTTANAPATFDSLSGEGIADQQQVAFDAAEMFAASVLAQATRWAGTPSGETGGRAWGAGFGQSSTLDGNAGTGAASVTSQTTGGAAGVDFRLLPSVMLGFAAGYSNSTFDVDARSTSGHLDGTQAAVYGAGNAGPLYAAGTLAYGHFNNSLNRTAYGSGEGSSFGSNSWVARAEAGYQIALSPANVTPFVGFQASWLANPSFAETSPSGGMAGLSVASQTVNSDKFYVGAQFDTNVSLGGGLVLTPYARVAWEHEFRTVRSMDAAFQALPGSNFIVYGAPGAADLARVDAGATVNLMANLVLYAEFDGAFAGNGSGYAGRGGVRLSW